MGGTTAVLPIVGGRVTKRRRHSGLEKSKVPVQRPRFAPKALLGEFWAPDVAAICSECIGNTVRQRP
jgi:hypothetical protein